MVRKISRRTSRSKTNRVRKISRKTKMTKKIVSVPKRGKNVFDVLKKYDLKQVKIDTISLTSGTVVATDPGMSSSKAEIKQSQTGWVLSPLISGIQTGTWNAYVMKAKLGGRWGERIVVLKAVDSKTRDIDVYDNKWEKANEVGVDTGQAGIYDFGDFPNDLEEREPLEISKTPIKIGPYGITSSSGIGDGFYGVYKYKASNGKIIGVMIVFINMYALSLYNM